MAGAGALGERGVPAANADAVASWARSAAEYVEQEGVPRPVVVAIDGSAGAGKSTLAALTAQQLDDAPVVHMDDLYPGWDGLAQGICVLVDKVLAPVSRGERGWYARYDWITADHAEVIIVPAHRYLVVEGVGASCGDARQYADVRIWMHAAEALRRQRTEARDVGSFGSNWEHWARQERVVFRADRPDEHAHLDIETD